MENMLRMNIDLRLERHAVLNNTKIKLQFADAVLGHVILEFPNTNDNVDKVLDTDKYSSFPKLDQAIERRLQNTKIDAKYINKRERLGLKMCVKYDNRCYDIWGVRNEHTYYLYWLHALTRYNTLGYICKTCENIPVLVEFNGSGELLNLVPFDSAQMELETEPLCLEHIEQIGVPLVEMFTCERISNDHHQQKRIHTDSASNIDYNVKNVCIENMDDVQLLIESQEITAEDETDIFLMK